MTIAELVEMAEVIHAAEGVNLGAKSTREQRNAFWARVIGCAYWGHPRYNAKPDKQWHLKKADANRPQTDDVATSMPSREHWDCIPGAGADGYRFEAHSAGRLPSDQVVYPPEKPSDWASPVPEPTPVPPSPPQAAQPPGREEALDEMKWLDGFYKATEGLQREQGLSLDGRPDLEGIAAWYLDVYQRARMAMKSRAESRAEVVKAIQGTDEWKRKHPESSK